MFRTTNDRLVIFPLVQKTLDIFEEKFIENITNFFNACVGTIDNQPGAFDKLTTLATRLGTSALIGKVFGSGTEGALQLIGMVPGVGNTDGLAKGIGDGVKASVQLGTGAIYQHKDRKEKKKLGEAEKTVSEIHDISKYFFQDNDKDGFDEFAKRLANTIMSEFIYAFIELSKYNNIKNATDNMADFFASLTMRDLLTSTYKGSLSSRICLHQDGNYYNYLDSIIPPKKDDEVYTKFFKAKNKKITYKHKSWPKTDKQWSFSGLMLSSPLLDARNGLLYLITDGKKGDRSVKYPPRLVFNMQTRKKTLHCNFHETMSAINLNPPLMIDLNDIIGKIDYETLIQKDEAFGKIQKDVDKVYHNKATDFDPSKEKLSKEKRKEFCSFMRDKHLSHDKMMASLKEYVKALFEFYWYKVKYLGIIATPHEVLFLANEVACLQSLMSQLTPEKGGGKEKSAAKIKLVIGEYFELLDKIKDIQLVQANEFYVKEDYAKDDGRELVFPFWLRREHDAEIIELRNRFQKEAIALQKDKIEFLKSKQAQLEIDDKKSQAFTLYRDEKYIECQKKLDELYAIYSQHKDIDLKVEELQATMYHRNGQYDEAISKGNDILSSPNFSDKEKIPARYLLATLHIECGHIAEARENIDAILKLDPDHEEALKLQSEIESMKFSRGK